MNATAEAYAIIPDDQPLAMMTAGDLRRLIATEWMQREAQARATAQAAATTKQEPAAPRYIVGLENMAAYLEMSLKTFNRHRKRGLFDGVIYRMGNNFRAKPAELDAAYDRNNA